MFAIPTWLLTAWPWIKKLGPWVMGALLLLGLYLWIDHRGYARAQAKDAKAISAITQQRDSWIAAFHQSDANFRVAIAAVNQQNADSLARAHAYNASKIANAKNIAAANAAWEKSETSRAALADIVRNGKSGCKPSAKLLNAIGDDV